jgi:hypothetical protein
MSHRLSLNEMRKLISIYKSAGKFFFCRFPVLGTHLLILQLNFRAAEKSVKAKALFYIPSFYIRT